MKERNDNKKGDSNPGRKSFGKFAAGEIWTKLRRIGAACLRCRVLFFGRSRWFTTAMQMPDHVSPVIMMWIRCEKGNRRGRLAQLKNTHLTVIKTAIRPKESAALRYDTTSVVTLWFTSQWPCPMNEPNSSRVRPCFFISFFRPPLSMNNARTLYTFATFTRWKTEGIWTLFFIIPFFTFV